MLATSSAEWATRARRLREHGMSVSAAERHARREARCSSSTSRPGFNYRMTDIQAAVGLVQLERLDDDRRHAAASSRAATRSCSPTCPASRRSRDPARRHDELPVVLGAVRPRMFPSAATSCSPRLNEAGISARRGIMAAHLEPAYADHPHRPLPVTERLTRRSLILPLFHEMTERSRTGSSTRSSTRSTSDAEEPEMLEHPGADAGGPDHREVAAHAPLRRQHLDRAAGRRKVYEPTPRWMRPFVRTHIQRADPGARRRRPRGARRRDLRDRRAERRRQDDAVPHHRRPDDADDAAAGRVLGLRRRARVRGDPPGRRLDAGGGPQPADAGDVQGEPAPPRPPAGHDRPRAAPARIPEILEVVGLSPTGRQHRRQPVGGHEGAAAAGAGAAARPARAAPRRADRRDRPDRRARAAATSSWISPASDGLAVLISSHRLEEIEALQSNALLLDQRPGAVRRRPGRPAQRVGATRSSRSRFARPTSAARGPPRTDRRPGRRDRRCEGATRPVPAARPSSDSATCSRRCAGVAARGPAHPGDPDAAARSDRARVLPTRPQRSGGESDEHDGSRAAARRRNGAHRRYDTFAAYLRHRHHRGPHVPGQHRAAVRRGRRAGVPVLLPGRLPGCQRRSSPRRSSASASPAGLQDALIGFTGRLQFAQERGTLETYLVEPVSWTLIPVAMNVWRSVTGSVIGLRHAVHRLRCSAPSSTSARLRAVLGDPRARHGRLQRRRRCFAASFLVLFKRGEPVIALYGLAAALLGGTLFPITVLPAWIRWASYLVPHAYVISAARAILVPARLPAGSTRTSHAWCWWSSTWSPSPSARGCSAARSSRARRTGVLST